jgi:Na+-driven multidrug efflux pump
MPRPGLPSLLALYARRYLALAALFFWQGGFTFYAAVVVPVGQDVLGSHFEQGLITRRVTVYLNLAGAIALLPLVWDAVGTRDPAPWRRRLRLLLWLGMAAALVALYRLHPLVDQYLELDSHNLTDRRAFRHYHRLYLWVSTVQWGCAVVYLLLSLLAWRAEDRRGLLATPDQEDGLPPSPS